VRGVLDGLRVIEVAQYVFVPTAAAVLAEWGADVVKVEPPGGGDAYRGLRQSGPLKVDAAVNYAIHHANRGKRSIGIDLATREGHALLMELVRDADVFLTNLRPGARRRLGIEVDDLRRHNSRLIYARGSALGQRGPEAERGGFDYSTFWARGGSALGATPVGAERPVPMPGPAYGDTTGAAILAGGIAAALFARERTGEANEVDVSLLGLGMWSMGSAIAASLVHDRAYEPMARIPPTNALAGVYRTADDRWISLTLLQGFPFFAPLCRCLGRPELASDPRFADPEAFVSNTAACAGILDGIFASEPLAIWRERLADLEGVWSVFQDTLEVARDPQAVANDYIVEVELGDLEGHVCPLVANPVQFGGRPGTTRPAPEYAQHSEEILLERGKTWDEIHALKACGALT
jgi:crotonobetainyl-CoA:carnitine CoA-transferase CaiB-like acyl-CoA transferase